MQVRIQSCFLWNTDAWRSSISLHTSTLESSRAKLIWASSWNRCCWPLEEWTIGAIQPGALLHYSVTTTLPATLQASGLQTVYSGKVISYWMLPNSKKTGHNSSPLFPNRSALSRLQKEGARQSPRTRFTSSIRGNWLIEMNKFCTKIFAVLNVGVAVTYKEYLLGGKSSHKSTLKKLQRQKSPFSFSHPDCSWVSFHPADAKRSILKICTTKVLKGTRGSRNTSCISYVTEFLRLHFHCCCCCW